MENNYPCCCLHLKRLDQYATAQKGGKSEDDQYCLGSSKSSHKDSLKIISSYKEEEEKVLHNLQ